MPVKKLVKKPATGGKKPKPAKATAKPAKELKSKNPKAQPVKKGAKSLAAKAKTPKLSTQKLKPTTAKIKVSKPQSAKVKAKPSVAKVKAQSARSNKKALNLKQPAKPGAKAVATSKGVKNKRVLKTNQPKAQKAQNTKLNPTAIKYAKVKADTEKRKAEPARPKRTVAKSYASHRKSSLESTAKSLALEFSNPNTQEILEKLNFLIENLVARGQLIRNEQLYIENEALSEPIPEENQGPSVKHAHDAIFKNVLQSPNVAKAFFNQNLPKEIMQIADLRTLKLCPETFIDRNLKRHQTDVLYSFDVKASSVDEAKDGKQLAKNKKAYLYILVENQSSDDPLMAWRMHQYATKIIERHLKITNSTTLPFVFTSVFYNGAKSPYPYSSSIFDLFGENKELAKARMGEFHLIDLTQTPDDEILKNKWTGAFQLIMKHIRSRELLNYLESLIDILKFLAEHGEDECILSLVTYILAKADIDDYDRFFKFIRDNLPKPVEEAAMTIAEQLRQEGIQQGMQQGIQQGMQQGMQQGEQEATKKVFLELLKEKFPDVSTDVSEKANHANVTELLNWTKHVLKANSVEEIFSDKLED
mgnify:CR=1 FL=1